VLDSAAENAGIADGEDALCEADRIGEVDDKVLLENMGGRLICHGEYGLMVERGNWGGLAQSGSQ